MQAPAGRSPGGVASSSSAASPSSSSSAVSAPDLCGVEAAHQLQQQQEQQLAPMGAVDGLVDAAGGCAVIDGGMSTQLEAHGAVFDETLWSALCLHTSPHLIKKRLELM